MMYYNMRELVWHSWVGTEVIISAVLHFVYALLIFSSALVAEASGPFSPGKLSWQSSKVVPLDINDEDGDDDCCSQPNQGLSFISPSNTIHDHSFQEAFDEAPIVLVHGIFGFGEGKMGKFSYWGGAETKDNRVLNPDLGPLTSMHDRACELFYYLKGGTVDYGTAHSQKCGHSRYGRHYAEGHYPKWDENHPVHFVGHSTGVQVVRILQQMLADKKFEGHTHTSADWVLSLTSLSGALNGTTRVYFDGLRPEDGRTMKTVSLLQLLRIGVLLYEWLDIYWLKHYYSFGFDHYNLSWRKSGLKGLVNSLLNKSGPFASGDWILPDLSIQTSVQINHGLKTNRNTYYFSYATKRTRKLFGQTVPSSICDIHPLFFLRTLQMSFWIHPSTALLPYEGYRDEDWQDNDGALNTISMLYPRFPNPHPNFPLESGFKDGQVLQPGIWYHTVLEADHIMFIINPDRAGVHFDLLYDSIFQRCRKQMRRSIPNEDHVSVTKVID